MKKFILTSACTLVLSLIGAFGSNQNSMNLDQNSTTTEVVKSVTDIENEQSLPSDDQTNAAAPVATAKPANKAAATDTDQATPDKNEDAKDVYLEEKNGNDDVIQNTKEDSEDIEVTAVKSSSAPASQTASNAVKSNNAIANNNTKNEQVLVYKNVDLSKCSSVNDVVKKLQENGYTNITNGNIQNMKSLNDILAAIQGRRQFNKGSAPTTTPVPTAKPTPTKTPTSTTTPAPTTKPAADTSSVGAYAREVLRLVNIERQRAGLSTYTTNASLTAAADKRAEETVVSFSHTRPNGTGFQTVLADYGISYRAAGENIAYGQRTPQEVVTGWMNSPGHRANILNANFNKIGIGVYQRNGVIYWTQEFTN